MQLAVGEDGAACAAEGVAVGAGYRAAVGGDFAELEVAVEAGAVCLWGDVPVGVVAAGYAGYVAGVVFAVETV